MPASPEVFRALGALCEPPDPAHAGLAAALGLPPPTDAATFTEVFVFQLVPYAAPYLSPEGMLGGEAGDRVAGFWRALQLTPPAEPDHLAALLSLYAALGERESAEVRPGAAGAWREARRALLWEHLLTWVPAYTRAMTALSSAGFHAAWAELLREALLEEACTLTPPPTRPLHLRDVPALPDARPDMEPGAGPDGLVRALLAPVRSGLLITRSDLAAAAAATGLGARVGGRAFTLHALIDSDRAATFGWLAQRAAWWAERHRADVPYLPGIAPHWLGRAQASLRMLEQLPQPA
jgi:TorA maturation chaperone TorD